MTAPVTVDFVRPRKLAAVRREVAPGAVGSAWKPALDQVWAFVRSQPGLWSGGHNVFVYRKPERPGALVCDFGVEVTRDFEPSGEVHLTETPEGEAAIAVHRGPYDRMRDAYDAIAQWMAANHRNAAGVSWEIYGDPTPDPADTSTTIVQLLQPAG
ncbi:MAG TPA: GyrI-like domain-containing protein [Candidatus Dormibacteraeota bacterium]|nr:GyrI-like domain-containing protein [Candidatus Dormibacteraeota bacterium]